MLFVLTKAWGTTPPKKIVLVLNAELVRRIEADERVTRNKIHAGPG